jgi:hypothetical protein
MQRNPLPVQCLEPIDRRLGREGILGSKKEGLEAGVCNRRGGREAARTVLWPDIGAQIRQRLGATFRARTARHEVSHLGEGDEARPNDDHLDAASRIRFGDPFPAQLAHAISVGRAQRMSFVDRQIAGWHVRVAVIQAQHRAARRVDHPTNARAMARLEQIPRSHRVDLHRRGIVRRDRAVDAAEMHDNVDTAQRKAEGLEVAQVGHVTLGCRADVEHTHAVPGQLSHDITTEPSQPAGDRYSHVMAFRACRSRR